VLSLAADLSRSRDAGFENNRPSLADRGENGHIAVMKNVSVVIAIIALGLVLGGCSKCGPFWEDWRSTPKSCQSDLPK
jgi:hypothetical protein